MARPRRRYRPPGPRGLIVPRSAAPRPAPESGPTASVPFATYLTFQEVFGRESTLAEIQNCIRSRSLRDWLYLAARMNGVVTYHQVLEPEAEAEALKAFFSQEDLRRVEAARATRQHIVFHRHQFLVFLRLLLSTAGLPPHSDSADVDFGHDVGPMFLAINDHLDDGLREVVTDDSTPREVRRQALQDYSLLKSDLVGGEVARYAIQRELDLTLDLPKQIDAAIADDLHHHITAALGLAPEEFISLAFAVLGVPATPPTKPGEAPALYFNLPEYLRQFGIEESRKQRFISLISQTEHHARQNAGTADPWTPDFVYRFQSFRNWPVVTLSNAQSITVAPNFLMRRMTTDFYDLIHYKVGRLDDGQRLAKLLEKMRGDAAELYVRRLMESVVATRCVPTARVPPQFKYDRSKEGGDVLLMYGDKGILLVFEVKNSASSAPLIAEKGPINPFRKGTALYKALRTLGRLVGEGELGDKGRPVGDIQRGALDHLVPDLSKFHRIIPVIAARQVPFNTTILRAALDENARSHGLVASTRVSPVAMLNFDELELAPALEQHGISFPNKLLQWTCDRVQNADSFTNFLWRTNKKLVSLATSDLNARRDAVSERIWDILRVQKAPDPPAAPPPT